MAILLADFFAWRFTGRWSTQARLVVRAALFCALTYVLFAFGMNPLRAAPWPDEALRHLLAQMLELVWWLQGARLLTILLDRLVLPETWHKERLFQDVLGALVFLAAGVAAIAFVLELPVKGLLATSGALAIVIGLAIQSTLNDVFSGVVLNATQPFRIDDWVTIGDVEGRVVSSDWRATSLLNAQGNIVVIPNSVAARTNIVNTNRPMHSHGVTVTLPLDRSVRPAVVLDALRNATFSSIEILEEPKPLVCVRRATDVAFEYDIVCYVDSLDKKISVRDEVFDAAHRHLRSAGVELHALGALAPAGSPPSQADERYRLLRNVSIFDSCADDELEALAGELVMRRLDPGEVVYSAATNGRELQIIARGVAEMTVPKDGRDIRLRRLMPGDSVGQSGILAGVVSHVTVRAVTRVNVYGLDKDALTPILERRPEITKEMCRLLTVHREKDHFVLSVPDHVSQTPLSIIEWIREGVRRFHALGS